MGRSPKAAPILNGFLIWVSSVGQFWVSSQHQLFNGTHKDPIVDTTREVKYEEVNSLMVRPNRRYKIQRLH